MAKNDSRRGRGEGALFYRADRDRWIARVIVDGQPRAVSAKTKTEARRKLDELRDLESTLNALVCGCDTACAGGAALDCSILEDLAVGRDGATQPSSRNCCG